jgi:putative transcriptional regulator
MTKKTNDLAKGILAGLEEAAAHINGEPDNVRVTKFTFANAKAIRERLSMSQSEFSRAYGIPLDTLQNWEQRRTNPDRTASAYLWAIEDLPQQISKAQQRHQMQTANIEQRQGQ